MGGSAAWWVNGKPQTEVRINWVHLVTIYVDNVLYVDDVEIHDEEHVCQKKKSPSNKTLVKDGLKSNLSAVEATSQLKVLCRKFAALTEKIKVASNLPRIPTVLRCMVCN